MDKTPRLLFTRPQKLTQQADFDAVFNKAQKNQQNCLLALYRSNNFDFARLGVIVSKRVAKSAVVRNQIKRVIRDSFRNQQHRLTKFDIIVLARQNCGKLSKKELRQDIDILWEKLINYQKKSV